MPSPPGNLPDPGIEPPSPVSPALADGFFTTSATWEVDQGGSGDKLGTNVQFQGMKGCFRRAVASAEKTERGGLVVRSYQLLCETEVTLNLIYCIKNAFSLPKILSEIQATRSNVEKIYPNVNYGHAKSIFLVLKIYIIKLQPG